MNIPQNAIYERSNDKHPGLLVMQEGKSAAAKIPLKLLKEAINSLTALLTDDGEFFTFITSTSKEATNKLIATRNRLSTQISGSLFDLRNAKAQITMPDPFYFTEKYQKLVKDIDAGIVDEKKATLAFAGEFFLAMEDSIEKNKESAIAAGITLSSPNLEAGGNPIGKPPKHK